MKSVLYLNKLLIFLILFNLSAAGQTLPKVIPPSPEVSALFRFQDYPMDYSTGLPQISIPIYEVKSGSLSVPISLSYHASGRRVMDEDGPVALGWSLNAGGSISRTVYGSVDFGTPSFGTYLFPSPFITTGLSNSGNLSYLQKIMHLNNPDENILPWTDSEYDIFSYNFGNSSGKFIFKDNNNVKTPALLPYKPYTITPYYTSRGISGIDILDDKGTLYQFIGTETSGLDNDYAVTGFSLQKIISADKTDEITFQYTGFAKWNKPTSQQRTAYADWDVNLTPNVAPYESTAEPALQSVYQVQRLKEINFKQGKVLFNLVAGSDKIDNIQVIALDNSVIKTIQVNRSVLDHLAEGGTSLNSNASQVNNKLDGLIFKDKSNAAVENYSFQYYPTIYYGSETAINPRYCDFWGYYNASGKTNMIPHYDLPGGMSVGGSDFDRLPNLTALKSGVLKTITYPTGGSTTFTYENNKYGDPSYYSGLDGPGLRVAQIASADNNGITTYKSYKYGIGENGYGVLDLKPNIYNMSNELAIVLFGYGGFYHNGFPDGAGACNQYTFSSGFNSSLNVLGLRPVVYTEVAEYFGTLVNNTGKTVYNYDYYGWAPSGLPYFNNSSALHTYSRLSNMHVYSWNFWNNPVLINKSDYKRINSTYNLVGNISNSFTITTVEDVAGLHVQRIASLPQWGISTVAACTAEQWGAIHWSSGTGGTSGGGPMYIYTFSDYHIPVGVKNLTSSTETIYNDDGSTISNTTTYSYNSRQYVSQTSQTGSDNKSIVTSIKYPFDYPGDPLLTQMITPALNMQNYPVEQSVVKNNLPVSSVRTNYFNWGTVTPRIYPQTIDGQKGANGYETRIHYYGYDVNGNPTDVAKEKDGINSYMWDYHDSYPVAEVKNAASDQIAYTSFEADGIGNWAGINTANVITTGNTVTGSKYYSFNATSLTKTGLTAATSYLVSYWTKNGMYSVTGTPVSGWPKTLATVTINGNTWTNWEHKVTGVTTVTVSGTGYIDELRLFPEKSFMTTYTFNPLVGMTSQSDINNRVSYYEYDAYGRVKLIRDMNNNIIKTFSYQYQSPTP